MRKEETFLVEHEVKNTVMPDIKSAIPGIMGWVLRAVFPKLEAKILDHIIRIIELILAGRK